MNRALLILAAFLILFVPLFSFGNVLHDSERRIKGSGSMRPTLDKDLYPETRTVNRDLSEVERLRLGRIYVYEKPDGVDVVHRLVGIYTIGNETIYVFKGDTNKLADEAVERSQVLEEVTGIKLY